MTNHRPKSLSELNNVYDKAMRAERAIKEGSSLLSTPDTEAAPESENIFRQLETKAAEAKKNQVFDPDITDIANDFLKRYAQPAKPKAAPQEIKRPAPSIQSIYHSPLKEKQDVPLSDGSDLTYAVKPQNTAVHKPAPVIPDTKVQSPAAAAVREEPTAEQPTVIYQAPEEEPEMPSAPAPSHIKEDTHEQAVVSKQKELYSEPAPKTDFTPRPVSSRVRITSTERSELMEEYMRVMSDEDDEPTYKKSRFSFFKKKKKYEEPEEAETSENLYEALPEEADTYEEIPDASSDMKYTDEYSDAPAQTQQINQTPMNLYDYIEADFDYDDSADDEALDMSFAEKTELSDDSDAEISENEIAVEESEPENIPVGEEQADEVSYQETEIPEAIAGDDEYPAENLSEEPQAAEEIPAPLTEISEEETAEEVIYPAETDENTEEITTGEENFCADAPPCDMVFEDIFSVSDESKRSHTGGNWNEVFGQEVLQPQTEEQEPEEAQDSSYADYSAEASEDEYTSKETAQDTAQESFESTDAYDRRKSSGGKVFAKILMIFVIILSLIGAAITTLLSVVVDIDSGKLFSEKYRAFSVSEDLETLGLAKGDLVITENTYVQADQLYVYKDQSDGSYDFGKVTASTSSLAGDYLYITQSEDGILLINRDTSLGVITAAYSSVGALVSVICSYSVFIVAALGILAVAMIICLVLLGRKQRNSDDSFTSPDSRDNSDDDSEDSDDNSSDDESDDDGEYYSDYDTDGIEQGLFVSI